MIDHKTYPIDNRWVIGMTVLFAAGTLLSGCIYLLDVTDIYFLVLTIILFVRTLYPYLFKATFSYQLEKEFLIVKKGIINRQERHLPYAVIQDILVRQNLVERIFGVATVVVQNATQMNIAQPKQVLGITIESKGARNKRLAAMRKNNVTIPGLAAGNARLLKEAVLQKMKENPYKDIRSGL